MRYGAMVALFPPFVASGFGEMCAMPCKGPAVVLRPYDGCVQGVEVFKEHFVVEVVAVQHVQVYDVGLQFLYISDEPPCGFVAA